MDENSVPANTVRGIEGVDHAKAQRSVFHRRGCGTQGVRCDLNGTIRRWNNFSLLVYRGICWKRTIQRRGGLGAVQPVLERIAEITS